MKNLKWETVYKTVNDGEKDCQIAVHDFGFGITVEADFTNQTIVKKSGEIAVADLGSSEMSAKEYTKMICSIAEEVAYCSAESAKWAD